jgi:O-antigen/teichoic acid export membrane protein
MTGRLRDIWKRINTDGVASRLAGPALTSVVIKIASAALSYLMLVAFARMLTTADYGYFGVMMNTALVASVFVGIGLPVAVMRFWSSHIERNEEHYALGFIAWSIRLMLLTSTIALLTGILLTVFDVTSDLFGLQLGAVVVAVFSVLVAASEYLSGLLRALGHTLTALAPRDILWRMLSPTVAAVWLLNTGQMSGGTAIAVCTFVLLLIVIWQGVVASRSISKVVGATSAQQNHTKWAAPLLPIAGASILFAMVQQLDVVIVGSLLGAEAAGGYFAAQKTASLLGLVMIAGGMVAAPMMAAAFEGKRTQELQRICKLLSATIALSTLVGLVVLALIGEELLAVFNAEYRAAYPVLMLLALGYAFDAIAGPTAYLMQMTNLESDYLKIMALAYMLVLALQIVFVPIYGVLAAAAATSFGYLLWNVIAISLLRSRVGVDSSLLSFIWPIKQRQS